MLFPCSLFRASAALLALGALPLSAAEQPDPAQARPVVSITDLNPVRLTRDAHSKLLVAQCTINGVPCNLIVDTAASHTTFDIKFIKKNFPGLPLENAQIAPGSNVNTVPQLFAMKTFSIGGLHIKNFFGLAMDLTPLQKDMQVRVDGILGINYLGFSPFLLSVRDASLQFLERSRFPSQNMKPLEVERHPSGIFYVRCSRGGDAFLLALDSGS
ncbi:retropepsin-like aspartic protease, partial [Akkermansia sp.]